MSIKNHKTGSNGCGIWDKPFRSFKKAAYFDVLQPAEYQHIRHLAHKKTPQKCPFLPIFPYHLAHIKDMFTVRKAYIYECKVMLYKSPISFLREKRTFSAILNLLFHHFNSISRIYTKVVLLTSFANNIIKVNNSTIKLRHLHIFHYLCTC